MRNQVVLLEHAPPVPLKFLLENFMLKFTSHPLRIPDTLASTTVHFFERRRLRARIPPNAVMTTP